MAKYDITMTVEFAGQIEADSRDEAEQLAMSSWADDYSQPITYQQVVDVDVDEVEVCDDCEEELHICACEEEMANA